MFILNLLFSGLNACKENLRPYILMANNFFLKGAKWLLGDIELLFDTQSLEQTLIDNTKHQHDGHHMGLLRFGPIHLVMFDDNLSTNPYYLEQFKTLVNIHGTKARSAYQMIDVLAGSHFLLGNNQPGSLELHKTLARYLKPKRMIAQIEIHLPKFFMVLKEITHSKNLYHIDLFQLTCAINHYTLSVFSHTLYGVPMTEPLQEIIIDLETNLTDPKALLLPKSLLFLLPGVKNKRERINFAFRDFFEKRYLKLDELIEAGEDNLLTSTMKKLLPSNKRLSDLTLNERIRMADHVNFRNAILTLIAIGNTMTILHGILIRLTEFYYQDDVHSLVNEIRQLDEKSLLDLKSLSHNSSQVLQVLYQQLVRYHSKFTQILRYTDHAIETPHVRIPKRSVIILPLKPKSDDSVEISPTHNIMVYFHQPKIYFSYLAKKNDRPKQSLLETIDIKDGLLLIVSQNQHYTLYIPKEKALFPFPHGIQDCFDAFSLPDIRQTTNNTFPNYIALNQNKQTQHLVEAIKSMVLKDAFNQPLKAKATLGKGELIPFSVGPRQCPGAHITSIFIKLTMINFMRHIDCLSSYCISFSSQSIYHDNLPPNSSIRHNEWEKGNKLQRAPSYKTGLAHCFFQEESEIGENNGWEDLTSTSNPNTLDE